jgi:tetratricopeptide (TPR) repeat protein
MRRAPFALTVITLLLAACVAHEKVADKAASTGDWKTAEREYAEALRHDPKDKAAVEAKWQAARGRAITEAQRHAQACVVGHDWDCALAESSYVLGLDPGDAGMAAVRRDAAREVGRQRLREASAAYDRGESGRAMELLEAARDVTNDPGVESDVRRWIPAVTRLASTDADRLRAARQFPQAIDLLARASRLDPGYGGQLQAVQAEYEQWKDFEAERFTREGDGFLRARQWGEAKARYQQAVALRPQSRAAALLRYADLLGDGEEAVSRRDFARAERLYREAAQSPADDGLARAALERVRVRPWAVTLRSVRVRHGGPRGPLVVVVRLPDGRAAQTAPREGSRASLEATFVVAANAYDERVVSARVFRLARPGDPPFDLGTVAFRLSDVVGREPFALEDGAVDELVVDAAPTDLPPGELRGLGPVAGPPPPPPAPPPPRPRRP